MIKNHDSRCKMSHYTCSSNPLTRTVGSDSVSIKNNWNAPGLNPDCDDASFSSILWQIEVPDRFWDPRREFKVLCSSHSTAVASACGDGPSVRRCDSKLKPPLTKN